MPIHQHRNVGVALGVLALAASAMVATSPVGATTPRVTLAPARVLPAGAEVGGTLGAAPLTVRVDLAPRDPAGLQAFADAVSTPGDPLYRHFIPKGVFATRFGASPSAVAAVRAWLTSLGVSSTGVKDGLYLDATGSPVAMGRAFGTTISSVSVGSQHFYANTSSISVPHAVATDIVAVSGLSNLKAATAQNVGVHPATLKASSAVGAAGVQAVTGSPTSPCSTVQGYQDPVQGPFTTTDLASTYHYPLSATSGAGETIALYELSSDTPSDDQGYNTCFGVSPSVTTVPVDGGPTDASGNVEVLLDTEIAASAAPGAAIDLYSGPNSDLGYLDTFSAIAHDDVAQVVSISWGSCEELSSHATLSAENTIFQQMAAQGQSAFVASGDSGSSGCSRMDGDTSVQPSDPGAQPYVTSVGGTTLVNGTCATFKSTCEVVWNDGYGIGGSGGRSNTFAAPAYQSKLKKKWREFPDVSAVASIYGGYLVYDATDSSTESPWIVVGGTSGAAPLEAAFTADSLAGGRGGLLNTLLYGLGSSYFNDITIGSNDVFSTLYSQYPATPGYDMASGLGSPNWSKLAGHVRSGQ